MTTAGSPKEPPELRCPLTFHSLRYSTSVLVQRRDLHARLIRATLGHGCLEFTYGVTAVDAGHAEAAREPEA